MSNSSSRSRQAGFTIWQWMVIDPAAPGNWSLSQAGKTVIY